VDRPSTWSGLLDAHKRLARYDRPSGAFYLLFPCLWSLYAAGVDSTVEMGTVVQTALSFTLGAFTLRAAGCIVNDMWDRDFDRQVFYNEFVWESAQIGVFLIGIR